MEQDFNQIIKWAKEYHLKYIVGYEIYCIVELTNLWDGLCSRMSSRLQGNLSKFNGCTLWNTLKSVTIYRL